MATAEGDGVGAGEPSGGSDTARGGAEFLPGTRRGIACSLESPGNVSARSRSSASGLANDHVEVDGVGAAARWAVAFFGRGLVGRQVRDDLAVAAHRLLQGLERLVDARQRKHHVQAVEREAVFYRRAQSVLFVFGEHAEHRGVDRELGEHLGAGAALGRVRGQLREQILDDRGCFFALGAVTALFLEREDLPVGFDRAEQQIERGVVEGNAVEAQVVEQILELVRHGGQRDGAKQRGEPLQGVHGAEHVVQEVGRGLALAFRRVEREQIAGQRVDELLRFREKFLSGLVRTVSVAAFHGSK